MPATVTLSVEIELAWGHHDITGGVHEALSPDREAETAALQRLLECCDELAIPVTFSVVGHLLEDSCSGSHDGPHPDGWFDADPGTDSETDPHFYAPDLVKRITEASTAHELGTHTYSHILCGEVDAGVVDWELVESARTHRERGLGGPQSLVPPRHSEPPEDVLRKQGIDCIRRPLRGYNGPPGGKVGTFLWSITRSHPPGKTGSSGGVTTTYCTPHPSLTAGFLPKGQRPPHLAYRAVPTRLRQWIHLRYLRAALAQAIVTGRPLHLWTHLYNMANDAQWPAIRTFLDELGDARDAGDVQVVTMDGLSPGDDGD